MDKRQMIFLYVFCVLLSTGCSEKNRHSNNTTNKVDEFYTIIGGWDWIRVPLIKPYEAKKINPKDTYSNWGMDFQQSLGTYNIRKIDVQSGIVYVFSGRVTETEDSSVLTLVNNVNVPNGWYVIDTKKSIEKSFSNEEEFIKYISDNEYPTAQWHDIDSLSKALSSNRHIPWMPK